MQIAYFVSPHGYGHASRAAGIMLALSEAMPDLRHHIFTLIPEWFFEASRVPNVIYHRQLTDIGLVQDTALIENLPETLRRLDEFMPFHPAMVDALAATLNRLDCRLVICDIAPLGIAVAQAAGLPSVLVENFTWDWIYQGYVEQAPAMQGYIDYLSDLFRAADYHIQTNPICEIHPTDLTVPPISRPGRTPANQIRQQLEITPQAQVVMLTMGGTRWDYTYLSRLETAGDTIFVIPGVGEEPARQGNVITLPHHSEFFHPDLINAADAVIGKVGYSTIAEVYQAGVPFGFVSRPHFRESPLLVDFIEREMSGLPISAEAFETGDWLTQLPDLFALPGINDRQENGARSVVQFIHRLLMSS